MPVQTRFSAASNPAQSAMSGCKDAVGHVREYLPLWVADHGIGCDVQIFHVHRGCRVQDLQAEMQTLAGKSFLRHLLPRRLHRRLLPAREFSLQPYYNGGCIGDYIAHGVMENHMENNMENKMETTTV